MAKLHERDWLKLLTGIHRLHAEMTVDGLAEVMLDVAQDLIACDHCSYDEVDLMERTTTGICSDRSVDEHWPKIEDAAAAYFHQHPVLHYFRSHPYSGARRISDFVDSAKFHETGLYRDCYRHIGVDHQLVARLPGNTNVEIGLALSRKRLDFSECDKQCLNLLRPHLHQAYKRCKALALLKTQYDTATATLNALPQGFALVDSANRVLLCTAQARQLLSRYLDLDSASDTYLPDPIGPWLDQQRQHLPFVVRACQPLTFRTEAGELIITASPAGGANTCLLCFDQRQTTDSSIAHLQRALNLTSRQAQVLYWVAQGKTNREIAHVLHVSHRTVQKHLELVFIRLNVASRTEAATMAIDTMNRP